MTGRKRLGIAVAALLALLLIAGCSSRGGVESDLGLRDAPGWVNQGSQALRDQGGRLIHGVGSVQSMADPSLQSATADNRARAEVARVLSTYMDVAMHDYARERGDGDFGAQEVSRRVDSLTRMNLSGARIIARWRDSESGMLYSLAELDMERVRATVAAAEGMDPGLRGYLTQRGDNIFDRLIEESAR